MGLERCWVSFPTSLQLLLFAEEACVRTPLQKQQSLPLRPVIPLVARISDQNASGAPPMTVREKTRLEKFRQLLSSHNTDLGECGRGWEGAVEGLCCLLWVVIRSTPGWKKQLPVDASSGVISQTALLAGGDVLHQLPACSQSFSTLQMVVVTGDCWALHEN